jgi:hypothetical protein
LFPGWGLVFQVAEVLEEEEGVFQEEAVAVEQPLF